MQPLEAHELLPIYVERCIYGDVVDFVAIKRAAHRLPSEGRDDDQSSTNGFTKEMIHKLRRLSLNGWSRALLELAFENPGKLVSFDEACRRANRGPSHGRAESVGFTKLIHREFGKTRGWPLCWKMEGNRTRYFATKEISQWWNEPEK
jgi:hypothetical protein